MEKTTKKSNANNNAKSMLISMYRNECKGFSAQVKYIYNLSLTEPSQHIDIPATPTRKDNSTEAVALREEIKSRRKQNKHIDEVNDAINLAKFIVNTLNISSVSKNAIKDIYQNGINLYPYKTSNNICVMGARLPEYLAKDYDDIYRIVVADWITVLYGAAKALSEKIPSLNSYSLSSSPVIDADNSVSESASGSLVLADMSIFENNAACEILAMWNDLAVCNKVACKAGSQKKIEIFNSMIECL